MPKPHLTPPQSAQFRRLLWRRTPPLPPLPSLGSLPSERHRHPPSFMSRLTPSVPPSGPPSALRSPALPTADTPGGPDTPPHALRAPDAFLTHLQTLRIQPLGMLSTGVGGRAGRAGGRGVPPTEKGGSRSGVVRPSVAGRPGRDVAQGTGSQPTATPGGEGKRDEEAVPAE